MGSRRYFFLLAIVLLLSIASPTLAAHPAARLPVTFNGRPVQFDVQPELVGDSTFVPLRALFELMGSTVTWDGATRTVTAVRGTTTIRLTVGSLTAYLNGMAKALPAEPYMKGDRTMLPLRFVSEAFAAQVDYNTLTTAITVLDPAWPPRLGGEAHLTLRNRPDGPLNPIINDDYYARHLTGMLFDGLWRYDAEMRPSPALAEAWEWDEEGTRLTFYLRRDARFHDGRAVTADDVVFSYKAWWHPQNLAGPVSGFEQVLGYSEYRVGRVGESATGVVTAAGLTGLFTLDEHTVVFRLSQPDAGLLYRLSGPVVDRFEFQDRPLEDWGAAANGTGPFRLSDYLPGVHARLTAHSRYWGGKPYLDGVLVQFGAGSDSPDVVESGFVPGLVVRKAPTLDFQYLGLNTRLGPLHDRRVREAVSRAVDRGALARFGLPQQSPVPPQVWGGALLAGPGHDPAAARRLLAESGWAVGPGGTRGLRLRLLYPSAGETRRQVAEAVGLMFRGVGIEVELIGLDFARLVGRLADPAEFDLFLAGFVGDLAGPVPMGVWERSGVGPDGPNRTGWWTPFSEDLLAQARGAADLTTRGQQYRQWAEHWVAEAPGIVLYTEQAQVGLSRRLQGVRLSAQGLPWNLGEWWLMQ